MKFFLFASLFISSLAHADFTCIDDSGGKFLNVTLSGKTFTVSFSNGSAVPRTATYKKIGEQRTRVGKQIHLQKLTDESSWKHMPMTLILGKNETHHNISLDGLPIKRVYFSPDECEINF